VLCVVLCVCAPRDASRRATCHLHLCLCLCLCSFTLSLIRLLVSLWERISRPQDFTFPCLCFGVDRGGGGGRKGWGGGRRGRGGGEGGSSGATLPFPPHTTHHRQHQPYPYPYPYPYHTDTTSQLASSGPAIYYVFLFIGSSTSQLLASLFFIQLLYSCVPVHCACVVCADAADDECAK